MNTLKVSDTTARFVKTLDSLKRTESDFLDALTSLYGEDSANGFYNQTTKDFDQVRNVISQYLTNSILDNLADLGSQDTI